MNAEKVRAMLDLSAQWDEAEIALRAAEKRYRQAVSLLSKEELAHFYQNRGRARRARTGYISQRGTEMTLYQGYNTPAKLTKDGLDPNSDLYSSRYEEARKVLLDLVGEKKGWEIIFSWGNYLSSYTRWKLTEKAIAELETPRCINGHMLTSRGECTVCGKAE